MKIVLDTNVIVSGLLSPYSAPGEIVRLAAAGSLELCFDVRILAEYRDVLKRPKFSFDPAQVDYFLEQLETSGHIVAAKPLAWRLPDSDDEPFMESAMAGEAQYLVTGNLKHFPKNRRQGVKVVTPAQFLEIFRKE